MGNWSSKVRRQLVRVLGVIEQFKLYLKSKVEEISESVRVWKITKVHRKHLCECVRRTLLELASYLRKYLL